MFAFLSKFLPLWTANTVILLWNVPSATGQRARVDVIINICRNSVSGIVTFEQTGSVTLPSGVSSRPQTTDNTPKFQKNDGIGFIQQNNFEEYDVTSNINSNCLDGSSLVFTTLDSGVPTLFVRPGSLFVGRNYASGNSVSGTADSASPVTMAGLGLNEGTTCFFEYDTNDDNTIDESDAAFVWNVGNDEGTGCPTLAPSNSPSESQAPSFLPSNSPSESQHPSILPSNSPSVSSAPSVRPSTNPSESQAPSNQPSNSPNESQAPTNQPSNSPSESQAPSNQPSNSPSESQAPSNQPSNSQPCPVTVPVNHRHLLRNLVPHQPLLTNPARIQVPHPLLLSCPATALVNLKLLRPCLAVIPVPHKLLLINSLSVSKRARPSLLLGKEEPSLLGRVVTG